MSWTDVRDPRPHWIPDFGPLFGIKPWEMDKLRPHELEAMHHYANEARKSGGES